MKRPKKILSIEKILRNDEKAISYLEPGAQLETRASSRKIYATRKRSRVESQSVVGRRRCCLCRVLSALALLPWTTMIKMLEIFSDIGMKKKTAVRPETFPCFSALWLCCHRRGFSCLSLGSSHWCRLSRECVYSATVITTA